MTSMTSSVRGRSAEEMVSEIRRGTGERSLRAFARAYLPHYFKHEPSAMHLEIADELERMVEDRGSRLAVAAPRGHAKSTLVTLGYILWCVLYGHEKFVVIISDTSDQARDMLTHIKHELEGNQRLVEDFPEACEQPGLKAPAERWRKDDLITRHGVRVMAIGSGQRLRGRRFKEARPTLIVLDDAENEESVRSPEQRTQKLEWFTSTVCKAGTGSTNMVAVGTVLHTESLLAGLLDGKKLPGWKALRYKALLEWPSRMDLWESWERVYNLTEEYGGRTGPGAATAYFTANRAAMEEGARVLWGPVDPIESLMTVRTRDGAASFEREKQNEPGGMENTLFRPEDIHYWDEDPRPDRPTSMVDADERVYRAATAEELIGKLGYSGSVVIGVDPSLGLPGKGHDNSGVVVLLRDSRTKVRYVLHAAMVRLRPDELLAHILQLCRQYQATRVAFESVHFQSVMANNLKQALDRASLNGVYVQEVKQTASKLSRFQAMQPLIAGGRVLFSRRQLNLLTELMQIPHGSHDDGPDALELSLRCAERGLFRFANCRKGAI